MRTLYAPLARSALLRRSRKDLPAWMMAFVACLGLAASGQARAETVVEYYNAALDHYFITPLANEIDDLDSGRQAGWTRTGLVFDAAASPAAALNPVCRFYIPPQHGDSHFLSASPDECAAVLAKIPTDPNFNGYLEETAAEFYIALPNTSTGACPAGTEPVYRLWNGRTDSNHRYTADAPTRAAMLARGYIVEGYGTLGVAMCTTRAGGSDSQVRVTGFSPFAPGCDNAPVTGVAAINAEVEPMLAISPQNPSNLIGVWQQDRWTDGGARGLLTGYSQDAGLTWSVSQAAFSHCTGGSAANGADFARASDPWVTIGPDGIAYQSAIAFNGATFASGSSSAVLASRSIDGGRTWSAPAALIRDGAQAFNDKESITADPFASGYAYAAWDRLLTSNNGPSYFSRTTNGGLAWETARPIYDPGGHNQTLNNQIVVTTPGAGMSTLFNFFTEFDVGQNNVVRRHLALVRSADRGLTWSGPITIADDRAVGTFDPQNPLITLRDAASIASFAGGPGGLLVVVWQDSRFTGGARDGVAFSRSLDAGATWSPPVQINSVPAVQALLPAVTVRADGVIGVLYYDMRNDTPDPATLLVDVWLTTSSDGVTWAERHVAGPFDFNFAPPAEGGLFIGDYQAIASTHGEFVPFAAQTNANPSNRTDILASVFRSIGPGGSLQKSVKPAYRALAAPPVAMTPQWQQRLQQSAQRTLGARRNGAGDTLDRPR